jgi:hypothetical protein
MPAMFLSPMKSENQWQLGTGFAKEDLNLKALTAKTNGSNQISSLIAWH